MVSSLKLKQTLYSGFLAVSLVLLLALMVFGRADAAGSASLALTPGSGQYYVNDTLTVRITENSGGEGVNAVEADLVYDKNVLQFVSIDASDSAFTIAAPTTTGGGVVNIPRAIPSVSLTGTQNVASVTFKVIAAGNSSITFAGSSAIVKTSGTQNIWNGAAGGGSYSFVNRPAAPSGGSSSPAPSGGSSGSSSGSTTKPGGSSSGSKPSSGGSSAGGGSTGGSSGSQSSGGDSSSSSADTGTPVTSTDANGYFVAIKVLDENSKPVKGAVVSLDNQQTAKTDAEGVAGFLSVANGNHTINVSYSGVSKVQSIAVKTPDPGAKSANIQSFDVKLAGLNEKSSWGLYVILTGAGAMALLFVFIMPRHQKLVVDSAVTPPENIVVGGNGVAPHTPGELIHPSNKNNDDPQNNIKP